MLLWGDVASHLLVDEHHRVALSTDIRMLYLMVARQWSTLVDVHLLGFVRQWERHQAVVVGVAGSFLVVRHQMVAVQEEWGSIFTHLIQ